jgi:hypothetical protein
VSGAEYQGPHAFRDFVEELADGHFDADVSRELLALLAECHVLAVTENTKAKGKLTIELNVATDPRGEVDVTYSTKIKRPARATARGRLWMVKGGPTAVHPKQLEVPGTERKRREPPPEPGRRHEEARPEDHDDGDDDGGLH